jgi:hypothetical protein
MRRKIQILLLALVLLFCISGQPAISQAESKLAPAETAFHKENRYF